MSKEDQKKELRLIDVVASDSSSSSSESEFDYYLEPYDKKTDIPENSKP